MNQTELLSADGYSSVETTNSQKLFSLNRDEFDAEVADSDAQWDGEVDTYAEQLSRTPIQFVFPWAFAFLQKLGCCRQRSFAHPKDELLP